MNARLGGAGSVVLAAVMFVAVNLVANNTLTSWRLDLTAEKVYTLSPGTRNILAGIREPVRLRLFFSARGLAGIPQLQSYGLRVRDLLEEYAAAAGGGIVLEVIDPEPFSEAEDLAVAYGLRQIALGAPGEYGYLGLVGTNSTDDERVIPFFNPADEARLEYTLSKLVYQLANPRRPVVGVLSPLALFGSPPNALTGRPARPAWTIVQWLREQYEVRDLGRNVREIGDDVDVLMVVHPKNLTARTRYAIDQYVLKGGRALVFVDPYSEADPTMPDPTTPMVLPERGSDMPKLLAAWGVKLRENAVAGDLEAAARIGYQGPRGPAETDYLPYLRLKPGNLNADDFVTAGLKGINMALAGVIDPLDDDSEGITTLIHTGPLSNTLNREGILFVRDPARLLDDFKPGNRELALAVRIRRPATTAFPEGRPLDEDEKRAPADKGFVRESRGPVNVVLVADTDLLSDRFWVQQQEVMGVRVPTPFADNGAFVVNAVDHLAGNDDLISLRSRGRAARPFDRVVRLQRAAEARFREREQKLRDELEQTERKLSELTARDGGGGGELLGAEERKALEEFRQQQIAIRKELRRVQRDLRRDIERLGTRIKLIDILAVPLAVALIAVAVAAVRRRRAQRRHAVARSG